MRYTDYDETTLDRPRPPSEALEPQESDRPSPEFEALVLDRPSPEFEALVLDHMNMMHGVALRLTRNQADAEDLVQNTVIKALRFHHRFQQGTYIKAWLLTILRNTFINEYRWRSRRPSTVELTGTEPAAARYSPDPIVRGEENPANSVDPMELLNDDVKQAVDSLPCEFRMAVVMADIEDTSYKDIAREMGCPVGTVMSRLHRGRKLLRKRLEGYARTHGLLASA